MGQKQINNNWAAGQGTGPKERRGGSQGLFAWWYALTAIAESAENSDPAKRDIIRKSRLLSVIVFFLLIIFVGFIPACLMLPNPFVLVADVSMLVICMVALMLNRAGKFSISGVLLVLSFEGALVMVIFTTIPLDGPSIQQYELFVFGELLAVSLLNARSVYLVAAFNSAIIIISLVFQPHTPMLDQDLQTQFWPMLVRPVAVQLLVAGVTYLWVSGAISYLARAIRAEIAATAAQREAEEQRKTAEQERQRLQVSIEEIVKNHAKSMNQHVITKIPLEQYEPVLWPLIGVFNSMQNRLQHAGQTQRELEVLKQAILASAEKVHQSQQLTLTQTDLDLLLIAQGTGPRSASPH